MNKTEANNWYEANQEYLTAELARIRERLESRAAQAMHSSRWPNFFRRFRKAWERRTTHAKSNEVKNSSEYPQSALEALCAAFDLSPFERDILLLCVGMELDSSFAMLCASAQGNPSRTYPTFSLALAALPNPHWSALSPAAPLRRWRLLEVGTGSTLTISPLHIDERVLHYLTGIQHLDERLVGIVEPLHVSGNLVPSHRVLAERLAITWSNRAGTSTFPIVQLCGDDVPSKNAIAAAICASLGLNLYAVSASVMPQNPNELDALIRLWEREAFLSAGALLVDCNDMDATDAARERAIMHLIESIRGAIIISSRERRCIRQRTMITFDVNKPTANEQRKIWQSILGKAASNLNGQVEALVSQFNLSDQTIRNAGTEALESFASIDDKTQVNELGNALWDACRMQTRSHLDDLAQRIEPAATWDDLVLPEQQRQILREIAVHVRQRFKVYEIWGFASKGSRGLGISALFVGASGTGKTMAAEVLANELRLDLYRIDLSQVVSKYIGETEKNLRKVFDAAEEGGAVLLFDEADALFGKRSEVKDSHDRYANIEISYLLQRMEAYRGLAILTTNMKNAIDTAFLRRIRFIVQFPFPDASQRAEIWQCIFPTDTQTEGLDMNKLARLNVAGGSIHNIALNAAFLAADAGEPVVRMKHLLQAARTEYTKLEKPLTEAEIGGWI